MLTYRGPDAAEVVDPTEDWLRARVLDADLAYWEGPAGDATIELRGDGRDADLVLIVQAEGALVRYRNFMTNAEHLAAEPPGDDDGFVGVYDGQEELMINRRFLVPRSAAWTAVEAFARTGQPAPSLRWEDQLEMQE
jgi:hypothetical protein